jgi:hypothetical protein
LEAGWLVLLGVPTLLFFWATHPRLLDAEAFAARRKRVRRASNWHWSNAQLHAFARSHDIPVTSKTTYPEFMDALRKAGVELPPDPPAEGSDDAR